MSEKKHVIVIGAGFAGLQTVKKLSKDKNLRITFIDRKNHHLFQPLLYQVATAVLNPADRLHIKGKTLLFLWMK